MYGNYLERLYISTISKGMSGNLLKKVIAEFIGTFALVFAGCGAIMIHGIHPESMPLHVIPVTFGLVITVMIYAVGHISGAHFNPAVTLAFALVKRFSWNEVVPYWVGQFTGAIIAMAILVFSLPETSSFGVTVPTIAIWPAISWEIILTFFLMFVIISVATDSRAVGIMAGGAIGGTVMLDAFIGGAITGASMNPARSFAPAIFAGQFEHLWIYFLAPSIGAIAAAFVYEKIRCEPSADKVKAQGCC